MLLRDLLRVLVVDDMSTSRAILLQALETLGIRDATFAENGAAALERVQASRPDLILCDLYMPQMTGLELLHRIRSDPRTMGIGFILVTGRIDESVIRAGKDLGMNNYLAKPFTPARFRDCVEAVVGPL